MRITSAELNEFEGDLSLLSVDVNDSMKYYDGDTVSASRTGREPVNGLKVFELAKRAREWADELISAADAMDLRIRKALDSQA